MGGGLASGMFEITRIMIVGECDSRYMKMHFRSHWMRLAMKLSHCLYLISTFLQKMFQVVGI